MHPQVAINLGQWVAPQTAVLMPKWAFEWMMENAPEILVKKDTIDIHEFDDVPEGFNELMKTALNYNPRIQKK